MSTRSEEGSRLGVYLFYCALAALWADLGTLHRLQHGDSLLPVLVSLQCWTPFFWEQDRYGMLIPLLARPVTHPFYNLLLQGFLNVTCGLSAFFLLARYVAPRAVYPLVGVLGAASFLTLAPAPYRFDYLMDANYGVWLTLGFGGLIVAEPRPEGAARSWVRRAAALILIVLAHWVYLATALYLGTLVVCRTALAPGFLWEAARRLRGGLRQPGAMLLGVVRSGPGQALVLLAAGFAAGGALTQFAHHHTTSMIRVPVADWPHAWARLAVRTVQAFAPGTWPLVLGTAAGLVVASCLIGGRPRWSDIPGRDVAALGATALVVGLFMGTRHWLKLNDYEPRYLLPSVLLVQTALWMVIVAPLGPHLDRAARWRRRLPGLAAALLLTSVAWAYGLPSPRRVRADLDRLGTLTPDVLAAGCTHIAGNYWTVWKAVFHANLTLYERGDSRRVWGVTFRGQPASTLWASMPRTARCVCIPVNDPYGDNWLISFGFPRFQDVGRRPTVRVLRWRPEVRPAPPRR